MSAVKSGNHRLLHIILLSASAVALTWLFLSDMHEFVMPISLVFNLYMYSGLTSVYALAILYVMLRKDRSETPENSRSWNYLKITMGVLWIIDGLLQVQPEMSFGFTAFILVPASGTLPAWIQSAVSPVLSLWFRNNALLDSMSAVFQIFLGTGFLLLRSGKSVRILGAASILWALAIWVVGEGMGGFFQTGLSFLTGFPGSALIYAFATVPLVIRLSDAGLRKYLMIMMAVIFALSAVVQVLPFEGYWAAGSISSIPGGYALYPQPAFLARFLISVAQLASYPGIPWNLLVTALFAAEALLWIFTPKVAAVSTMALAGLVWVIGQDFGILGGYGTDPNTAVVILLLSYVWYLGTMGMPHGARNNEAMELPVHGS